MWEPSKVCSKYREREYYRIRDRVPEGMVSWGFASQRFTNLC